MTPDETCGECRPPSAPRGVLGRLTFAPQCSEGVPAPLCRITAELAYEAEDCVARLGDRRDRLVVLQSGILRLVRSQADGRRYIAGFLYPGDLVSFGERQATWSLDVEAVTAANLSVFEPCHARLLDGRLDGLHRWLFELACREARRAERHAAILAMPTPIERLAAFLLDLEEAKGTVAAERGQTARLATAVEALEIPMRRADIADYLALTIETVSRCFRRLVEAGVIRLPHPKRVLLLNRSALELHAGQLPPPCADIA